MAFQKTYTEELQNICSVGSTSNHLVNFQLVRGVPTDTVKQYSSSKPEYFCFVTLAPGTGGGDNRTYDFNQKITVKFSVSEICSIAFVLRTWANGMGKAVFPYTKFAKSGNGSKSVSVWEPQNQQGNDGKPKARMVSVTFKENNSNGYTISLAPADAFALAEQLTELFKLGTRLEFERQMAAPKVSQQPRGNGTSYQTYNQNMPPANQPMISNNPFGQNNDFQGISNEFENMLVSS